MTGTSWEHQREARDALRTIVADPQLGVAALSSAQTMSNLLKDLLPDAPKETSVLVAAAEAGLAQTLLDHVGQGAAAPGYAYPQRTVPGTVPGHGSRPRRTPKAWMILTGCVAMVALIGGIAALARHDNSSNATTIEPLSQLVKPDVTTCKSTVTLGLRGLTHREFCQTSVHNIGLDAYQFATASAYADGLSRLNTITGWSPSGAGTKCPPPSGDAGGQTLWHSNVNSRYRQRAGQILECYSLRRPSFLLYLWTLPTQRVILVANDNAAGATFADLEKWWSGLNYG